MSTLKKAGVAVLAFLLTPEARRYELPLAIGIYEAVRAAFGHP